VDAVAPFRVAHPEPSGVRRAQGHREAGRDGDVILLGEPFAVVAGLAPEHDRGRYLAAYGVCWGIATTVGPLLATGLMAAGGPVLLWLACAALCAALSVAQRPVRRAVTRT
jgi:MFS family permease